MNGFVGNIEDLAVTNNNFRKVIFTGQHVQLVVMSLLPNEDIGLEVHATTDQFLRIEQGQGKVVINGEEQTVVAGSGIIVPAGAKHNVTNTSSVEPLKLYTVYAPPHHKDGVIHHSKQDAQVDQTDHL